MFRKALACFLLIMCTVLSYGQQDVKEAEERGLRRVYLGYGLGTNFIQMQSSINLRLVFHNAPLVYLDYTNQSLEPVNIPAGYTPDFSVLFEGQPSDVLRSFSVMGGKEFRLRQNLVLMAVGGLNFSQDLGAHFEVIEKQGSKPTYELRRSVYEVAGGFSVRCGVTWIATRWCGISFELLGNLNDIQNYGGASFTLHLGWMGKEGWNKKLRLKRID